MGLLTSFAQRADREGLALHGIAVQQHGVFLEEKRWQADVPHILHSLSKSYTSTAIGMAIDEGAMKLTDRPVDYFPELLPEHVGPELEALSLRDLLMMAPGKESCMLSHQRMAIQDPDWVRYYLSRPFRQMPGQRFQYDTGCTYVAGAMLQKATGQRVRDYLMPRLFLRQGIFRPIWEECPLGRNLAGAGLYLRTKEILPLGQLYLEGGMWQGQRILSESWVQQASQVQIETALEDSRADNCLGYGYQFWRSKHGYRGDGAKGQFCMVLPEADAVIAVTSGEERDPQAILNAIWDEVYPRLMEKA